MGQHEANIGQRSPRFTVFCALPVFGTFSALVAQDGSTRANIGVRMGQHSPQDGDGPTWPPRWAKVAPSWANIAPRSANIAPKMGQDSPKMDQHSPKISPHSPKIGRRPSKYPAFYSVFFFAVPIFRIFWLNMHQHEANILQHSHKMGLHSWASGRLSRASA